MTKTKELNNGTTQKFNTHTWSKDGSTTGLVQEVIVLRRNDTTGHHHNIPGTQTMEFFI
jgi:hypothetical protein